MCQAVQLISSKRLEIDSCYLLLANFRLQHMTFHSFICATMPNDLEGGHGRFYEGHFSLGHERKHKKSAKLLQTYYIINFIIIIIICLNETEMAIINTIFKVFNAF